MTSNAQPREATAGACLPQAQKEALGAGKTRMERSNARGHDQQAASNTSLLSAHPLRPANTHLTPTAAAMSLTSRAAASLVRHTARQQLPAVRPCAAAMQVQQQRTKADMASSIESHAEFHSPYHRGTSAKQDTTVVPSFKKYRNGSESGNKIFQYFMVGAFGGLSALGAKDTVQRMQQYDTKEALYELAC